MLVSTRYLIFLNLLVDTVSWSMCLPSMPYIYATFGLTDVKIGFIASFVSTVIFVFGAIQGKVSEYVGKVPMLKLCAGSQLIGHIVFIFALYYKSFALFLVARCLPSMFKCGMVVSQALLYDISSENDVSRNIGTLMAFSNLSFIIGPVIGGFLYDWNPMYPFYVGVFTSTLNLLILSVLEAVLVPATSTVVVEDAKSSMSPSGELSNKSSAGYSNRPLARGIRFLRQRSYSINNAITTAIKQSNGSGAGDGKNKYSLLKYLHIRFAFQLNNSLLEALFSQHIKRTLMVSGSTVGQVMGYSSVISALTNGFILKRLLATYPMPEKFLLPLVLSMTVGLYGWALSRSMWLLVASVTITSVSSNLYLSITSSVIAQSQKLLEKNRITASAGSSSSTDTSESGSAKDSMTIDTSMDDTTTSGRSRSSSFAARSPPMPVKLVIASNTYHLPLVHSTVDLANTDSLGSELVVVDDQEIADPISGGRGASLSPTSEEGNDSGGSTDFAQSDLETDVQHGQQKHRVGDDDVGEISEDQYVEIDSLHDDSAGGKHSEWQTSRLDAKLETIVEDPSSEPTTPHVHALTPVKASTVVTTTTTKSTSAMVFGLSSTTDRFARILTPTLGSLFFRFGGGSVGLVYLISLVSVYCATLIVTTLPDRSETKETVLEKKLQ